MTDLKKLKKLKNQLITYNEIINIPSNITFGFEIEIENVLLERLEEKLKEMQVKDSIFNDYNVKIELSNISFCKRKVINGEVTTGILRDYKEHWESLKKILEMLKEENAIITKSCGCHVNVGTHVLGNNEDCWRNFLMLWKLYENEIFQFSTGEYKKIRSLKYINPISDRLDIAVLTKKYGNALEYLNNLPKFLFTREECCHNSLSLKKCTSFEYKKDNVIEFRTPNGTLNLDIYKNYMKFLHRFLYTCKGDLDIEKIIFDIENNNHSLEQLAELLFDNDIDKNNFLIQSLKTNKIYKKRIPEHIYSR